MPGTRVVNPRTGRGISIDVGSIGTPNRNLLNEVDPIVGTNSGVGLGVAYSG